MDSVETEAQRFPEEAEELRRPVGKGFKLSTPSARVGMPRIAQKVAALQRRAMFLPAGTPTRRLPGSPASPGARAPVTPVQIGHRDVDDGQGTEALRRGRAGTS